MIHKVGDRILYLLVFANLVACGLATSPPDIIRRLKDELAPELTGDAILRGSKEYESMRQMKTKQFTTYPLAIVAVNNTEDVQKSVLFARKYALHVSIHSCGHSYLGRSTGRGTFMIDLSRLQDIKVNQEDPDSDTGASADVQPGVNFKKINHEVDNYKLVAVGGMCQTVCIAGYSLGGGHGMLSRPLGLGADNLIKVKLVTAKGEVAEASENRTVIFDPNGRNRTVENGDLLWALRGGGGAFGVVTELKIKLHPAPQAFVGLRLTVQNAFADNMNKAKEVLKWYTELWPAPKLSSKWGGNVLMLYGFMKWVVVDLLYYGDWKEAKGSVQDLLDSVPQGAAHEAKNYSSYRKYLKNSMISGFQYSAQNAYIFSRLMQKADLLNGSLTDLLVDGYRQMPASTTFIPSNCYIIELGGKAAEFPSESSAVSDDMRKALWLFECQVFWTRPSQQDYLTEKARRFYAKVSNFGSGVYYNEADIYLENWSTEFWGDKYPRLQRIKRDWDPTDFFSCRMCVRAEQTSQDRDPLALYTASEQMSWGVWGGWSRCVGTWAGGVQARSRDCLVSECCGSAVEWSTCPRIN